MMNDNLQSADTAAPVETPHVSQSDAPSASLLQRIWLLLVVAVVSIVVDQITKRLVEARIELGGVEQIAAFLSPYLTLTHTKNPGAAFSILQEGGAIFFVLLY